MKKRSGFTLIELSIVLIIIGLIIGAVMKGKDLINSADQKKIYNTWLKEWAVVANQYQDRTGSVLGDGKANGGTQDTEDGLMDNVNLSNTTAVQAVLKKVGLSVPEGLNNGGSYLIKGKYTRATVAATLSPQDGGNAISMTNLPTDVAIAFDNMADGAMTPQTGDFRASDTTITNAEGWPDASATATNKVAVYLKI